MHKRRVRLAVDMLQASNRLERTPPHELKALLRQAAAMLVQPEEHSQASSASATPSDRVEPELASTRERARPYETGRQRATPLPAPVQHEPIVDIAFDAERTVVPRRLFALTRAPAAAWRAGAIVDAVSIEERVFAEDKIPESKPARRLNWRLFSVSFAVGLGGCAAVLIFRHSASLAAVEDWQSIILFAFVAVQAVFGVIGARALWPLWKQRGWGLVTDLLRRDSEA
jgi:hypothetical protein